MNPPRLVQTPSPNWSARRTNLIDTIVVLRLYTFTGFDGPYCLAGPRLPAVFAITAQEATVPFLVVQRKHPI